MKWKNPMNVQNWSRKKEQPISIHYSWAGEREGPQMRLVWNNQAQQTPEFFRISVGIKQGYVIGEQGKRMHDFYFYVFKTFFLSLENYLKILHFSIKLHWIKGIIFTV